MIFFTNGFACFVFQPESVRANQEEQLSRDQPEHDSAVCFRACSVSQALTQGAYHTLRSQASEYRISQAYSYILTYIICFFAISKLSKLK